ncbi:MAG: Stk1 family PASTA domain-containing Ser/Thr kinase [Butyribacter sp.]|nr:Stk1 family PASTA domain-containing Ser/Thr kinase [bacterium]MDY3855146.1 Stk1 family PASTA domain-containing Ser/Thr kinase [Butyribacter sp.]
MISPGMLISERYEIIDKVGTGGMADVYNAKDLRLNRNVAIKVLKQEYSNDAKFVSKFRAEAQSVAGLSHPNIVNVYDVGEDDNLYYIVMELVEGITLKKFIEKKGKLEINEAIGIGIQIAQGIEEAHKNHIIHRDIKPQNIIISTEGKVKVTDFGIAKAATSNTITSNAMGSVHYISPEQARGGYSDEKSDIYSLGVTLYEMLSGRVPFEGESTVSVAFAHVHEEATPLDQLDSDIPRSLSRIVQKCMQKKSDMRYNSAAALIMDLRRAVSDPDGDYVVLEEENDSPTIRMSDDMMRAIKDSKGIENIRQEEQKGVEADEDAIDPKLERILKICSGVVAVIIVVVVILLFGKLAGWWSGGSDDDKKSTVVETVSPQASAAADTVEVPDIVDKTLEEAEQILEDSNLRYNLEPVESDKEANTVTEQDPVAGEDVEEYTRVTIYYSKGDSGITIPSVENKTQADAMTTLEELGLTVAGVSKEYSESVEEGKVCGTDPVVGTSVAKGTAVTILVSKGPKSKMVPVPNIVGKKEEVALEKLSDVGLAGNTDNVTYVYSDKYAKGRITRQSVKAGTKVEVGTEIDYTVSKGPKTKATPQPTPKVTYDYIGTTTISANPFEYPDEDPAMIKLVLTQDGKSRTVYKGTLSYDDFPKKFTIKGWSENNGTITVCKGDDVLDGSYNVEFKKVAQ